MVVSLWKLDIRKNDYQALEYLSKCEREHGLENKKEPQTIRFGVL
jgi:hypothetical protein